MFKIRCLRDYWAELSFLILVVTLNGEMPARILTLVDVSRVKVAR